MAAGLYSLTGSNYIERGADYSFSLDINTSSGEYSLSGKLVSGMIYRSWDRSLEAYWNTTILSAVSGTVQFDLSGVQTANLSLAPMYHEIFVYDTGAQTATKVIYGDVMVFGGGVP